MHLQSSVPPTPSTPAPPVTMFSDTTSVFFRPFPTRWGDLPTIDDDPGIAALERDTVTKPRLMAVESMKLYQPCKPSDDAARLKQERKVSGLFGPTKNEPSSLHDSSATLTRFDVDADPKIIHSLQLSQYLRKMNTMISDHANSDGDKTPEAVGSKRKASSSLPPTSSSPKVTPPPLPASLDVKEVKREIPCLPFHPPPAEETLSAFAQGRWSSTTTAPSVPPVISNSTARQLVKKSVVTLVAHAGFDSASECAVDVLTDLLQSYLRQLTGNLADARDAEMTSDGSNFPDHLERVFTEMGVGSAKSLLRFYNRDVIYRHKQLRRQAEEVSAQYRTLTSTESSDGHTKLEASSEICGDSKAWFGGDNEGLAKVEGRADVTAASAAFFKREMDAKEAARNQSSFHAAHSIVPGQPLTTTDVTDYDADDDDVNTEPSSVKSIFENDTEDVVCDGAGSNVVADSGFDLVASSLISIPSPSSQSSIKGDKSSSTKKKKKK